MIPFASHREIDRLRSSADIIEQVDEQTTYLGFCQPGTLTTAENKWSIAKIEETGTLPTLTVFTWATGSCAYNLVWDNRAGYDYYFKKVLVMIVIDKIKGVLLHKHKATDISGLEETYTNADPMPETVHGLEVGSTFDQVPLTDMFTKLLYPYQYPAFLNFRLIDQSQLVEVGENLNTNKAVRWDLTTFANIVNNYGTIREMVLNEILDENINIWRLLDGISLVINNTEPILRSYRIEGKNTKEQIFVSNSFIIKSVFPMFIGSVDSINPTENMVKAMTKRVLEKANQAFTYTINSKLFCFAWPTIYGATLNSVKDTNQFEIISGFLFTTADFTINGVTQNYTIATLSAPTTQTNFTVTFIF